MHTCTTYIVDGVACGWTAIAKKQILDSQYLYKCTYYIHYIYSFTYSIFIHFCLIYMFIYIYLYVFIQKMCIYIYTPHKHVPFIQKEKSRLEAIPKKSQVVMLRQPREHVFSQYQFCKLATDPGDGRRASFMWFTWFPYGGSWGSPKLLIYVMENLIKMDDGKWIMGKLEPFARPIIGNKNIGFPGVFPSTNSLMVDWLWGEDYVPL